jgi:EAL domain-containing protein (putative c-di-GMP-specific phosphodiesterase class I)
MESDLREALELGQFQLHFQPIVDAAGRLVGAESLLRWHHPRRGRVPPGEFIPLCEESGLILEVGDWVLGEALSHMVRWRHRALMREGQYLSVNISPRQFRQRDFVELLIQRVEAAGVSPSQLALEITEGSVIGDSDDTLLNLQRLRTAGFRLLIDDFGVGYSSLSYLKRLPVHGIKIDQSFVRDIGSDPSDAALVQSLITIGTHFKLGVIAEGVETDQHSTLLRDMGCGYFQGYHFDRPQPGEAFEARWLLQRSRHEV